ncbi:MAG TPA: glycosyltransferase family 4 protein [Verrucomicrobiota bacterium]|nr:glycosyltransferase family 4 protein [Verrucomicrobiota bacterium]HQB16921.1 glycosyltransferase family 4 protein [Verrucomicrobiota bacterium]
MKLLVFAHTPPPHHGQSYMVQLLLDGFGGDCRRGGRPSPHGIECYHVNARFSKHLEDIGNFRLTKLILLLEYCLAAIFVRFRHGVRNFYYVPAPGKKSALWRDWLVMALCRPFFTRIILHWHAAGLAKWLETEQRISVRALTYRLMKSVDLSIVLSRYNLLDAEKLLARQVRVIGNGIPDPCPGYEQEIWPRRQARAAARSKLLAGKQLTAADRQQTGEDPQLLRVLFLAHCTREKGLFDTLEAVALANARLAAIRSPVRVHLTVAGSFLSPLEQLEFEQRITQSDLQLSPGTGVVTSSSPSQSCVCYVGFVTGSEKHRTFTQSDCFCFPTYYYAESFGLVILEAMAYGLPIVASRWRSIPELLPPDFPGLVPPCNPAAVATALVDLATTPSTDTLRTHFLEHYSLEQYLNNLATAIRALET